MSMYVKAQLPCYFLLLTLWLFSSVLEFEFQEGLFSMDLICTSFCLYPPYCKEQQDYASLSSTMFPLSLPHQKFTYRTAVACFSRDNSSLTQACSFWVDSWASVSCLTIHNKGLLRAVTACLWPVLHELFSRTAINYFVHQIFPTCPHTYKVDLIHPKYKLPYVIMIWMETATNGLSGQGCSTLRQLSLRMIPIQYHYSLECHLYNGKEVHLPMPYGGRLSPRIVPVYSLLQIEESSLNSHYSQHGPHSSTHFLVLSDPVAPMCCITFPGVTGTNILFIHVIEHQREIKEKNCTQL